MITTSFSTPSPTHRTAQNVCLNVRTRFVHIRQDIYCIYNVTISVSFAIISKIKKKKNLNISLHKRVPPSVFLTSSIFVFTCLLYTAAVLKQRYTLITRGGCVWGKSRNLVSNHPRCCVARVLVCDGRR